MTPRGPGLAEITTADLARLAGLLERCESGVPVSSPLLAASRLGRLWEPLVKIGVLEPRCLAAVVCAILSERDARTRSRADLVWTGLEAKTSLARPTEAVVRELFELAHGHVLIAGYTFDHGAEILKPLHEAMATRGVAVDIYLHVKRARRRQDIQKHLTAEVATFFAANWPFGTPHPAIYVAPRTVDPDVCESLHAKCIVVDARIALVGSANFTARGQARNIEVGARIEDAAFATALVAQFQSATHSAIFRQYTLP